MIFKKVKKSFTIIELSVVLTIIGILLSISIVGSRAIISNFKKKNNQQKIILIQNALQNYFNIYQRLPKPADYEIQRNNKNFGSEVNESKFWSEKTDYYASNFIFDKTTNKNKEEINKISIDTKIFYGIIPFKELKLNEEDAVDEYGNYIEYYVPEIMTIKKNDNISEILRPLEKIVKTGYSEKTANSGTYDLYKCPFKYGENMAFCDKNNDVVHGVKFKQFKVPDNYNQLTYIESSGQQFINTDISPYNAKIKMSFNITPIKFFNNNDKDCFFGTIEDGFSFEYSNIDGNIFAYFNAGSSNYLAKHKTLFLNKNNEYDVIYDNNKLIVKGAHDEENNYSDVLPGDKIYFFSNGNENCNSNIRLHYLKIYKNNILVRDYIPCINKNNNEVGLYDKVDNIFFKNNGLGSFISGEIKQNDYIEYNINPYGLKVKDVSTNLYINNNFAYVILSHGKNGRTTCAINKPHSQSSKPTIISILNESNATNETKYEAQNCMLIGRNLSLDIIGRNDFLSSTNKEITFYKGEENSDFDDICAYKTLDELMNNKLSKTI